VKASIFGVLLAVPLHAQLDLVITTIAGSSYSFRGDGGPATQAQLGQMTHVICDTQGNFYVADRMNHQVVRVSLSGVLTVVAGTGFDGYSGDGGPAKYAALSFPSAVALDASGDLYIGDSGNRRIRRVNRNGIIETIAGTGADASAGDLGPAVRASFKSTKGLAFDRAGNLYVSDELAHRIRRIGTDGIIRTTVGTGQAGYGGDGGAADRAQIQQPNHISFDAAGNLFIADWANNRVRRVNSDGIITTFAGRGLAVSDGDGGAATQAGLAGPTSVAADGRGNIYISELFDRVRVVNSANVIRTFAGQQARRGFAGDGGQAANALLNVITAIATDSAGNLYIADSLNLRVRRVNLTGTIETVAGSGQFRFTGDGGPAVAATFAAPLGMAVDLTGNIYFADADNHRIRRIGPDGRVTTIAGNGTPGFSGDGGQATAASLNLPTALTTDGNGNIYVADGLSRIRRIGPNGVITTIAGGGSQVSPPDGALATSLDIAAVSIASDQIGNLFVLDAPRCAILRITTDGRVSRFAGKYLDCGSNGDDGPARDARIQTLGSLLSGIAVDENGVVYLAEASPPRDAPSNAAGRVRRIDRNGTISHFAGSRRGDRFVEDLEPASGAPLLAPEAVLATRYGLFIGDGLFVYWVFNREVERLTGVPGLDGRIYRIAGNPFAEQLGDGGSARNARLLGTRTLAFDARENLLVADTANFRIRSILLGDTVVAATSPQLLQCEATSNGPVSTPQNLVLSSSVPNLGFTMQAATLNGGPWLKLPAQTATAPRVLPIVCDPTNVPPGLYSGSIRLESRFAVPATHTVIVSFRVTAPEPPRARIDKDNLAFPLAVDSPPQTQGVEISNAGGGTLETSVNVSTNNGGDWLTVAPPAGQARPGSPIAVTARADPAGLPPGTYTGNIEVVAGDRASSIPVTMTVSGNDRALVLSQTGLAFTTVANGGVAPVKTFEVVNIGKAPVSFSVSTSTLTGGSNWLTAFARRNFANPREVAPVVEVRVSQAGLAPGIHYGQVRVDAEGAANTPQVVTVAHEVLPAGSDPGPLVEPAALVFTTVAGNSPGAQEVFVYNVAQAPKIYRATGAMTNGTVQAQPSDATLPITQAQRILVQPFVGTLAPGVHLGSMNFQFSDGRVRAVRIKVIVTPGAGKEVSAEGCTPTKLVAAITSLAQAAPITIGWPVPVNAEVRDDCGTPQDGGTVVVTFSNGDPPLPLQPLREGRWSGTWPSRAGASGFETTLKLRASNTLSGLAGEETVSVSIRARQEAPSTEAGAVGSAVGFRAFAPLAPGALFSITGERLADATVTASSSPWPAQMSTTRVLIGSKSVPLQSISPGKIVGVVPADINIHTQHQIVIQRANTYSRPVSVQVGSAQPALYLADGTSTRQGQIYWVRGDSRGLATPDRPAASGDSLQINASGLGGTDPVVAAGQAAPSAASTVSPVSLKIGGIDVPVDFAGLAEGQVAVYRIEAKVPGGVSGDSVEVVIAVDGQLSLPVTMSIR
jgi:uncharacterized protein (TIGR03437 family)